MFSVFSEPEVMEAKNTHQLKSQMRQATQFFFLKMEKSCGSRKLRRLRQPMLSETVMVVRENEVGRCQVEPKV